MNIVNGGTIASQMEIMNIFVIIQLVQDIKWKQIIGIDVKALSGIKLMKQWFQKEN